MTTDTTDEQTEAPIDRGMRRRVSRQGHTVLERGSRALTVFAKWGRFHWSLTATAFVGRAEGAGVRYGGPVGRVGSDVRMSHRTGASCEAAGR